MRSLSEATRFQQSRDRRLLMRTIEATLARIQQGALHPPRLHTPTGKQRKRNSSVLTTAEAMTVKESALKNRRQDRWIVPRGSSVVGTSPIEALRLYAERFVPDAQLERTTYAVSKCQSRGVLVTCVICMFRGKHL